MSPILPDNLRRLPSWGGSPEAKTSATVLKVTVLTISGRSELKKIEMDATNQIIKGIAQTAGVIKKEAE